MKNRMVWCVTLVSLAMIPAACGGGADAPAPAAEEPAAAPAETSEAAVAGAEGAAGEAGMDAGADEGAFGVVECDSFFEKYFACIDANVPEEGRAAVRQAAEQTKASLMEANAPEAQDALIASCTSAAEAAKTALAAYNCEW